MTIDVDPIISLDDRSVFYTTRSGYERLDLRTNTSNFVPYGGNGPTLPKPVGVDPQIASQLYRGVPSGALVIPEHDAVDEDFMVSLLYGPLLFELFTSDLQDLHVSISNVPETAVSGYTFFSFDTSWPVGAGFFFGVRGYAVLQQLYDAGVMTKITGDSVLLSPPLVLEDKHIDEMFTKIRGVLAGQ